MSPEQVQSLVRSIEAKDGSTAAHTWRVVLYTRAVAEELSVGAEMLRRLTHAAALHDIGKIEIPDSILKKPGPLTPPEFAVIKAHAALGHAMLLSLGEEDPVVLNFVRHHHERLDGTGYPDGLTDAALSQGAKFFAVIDSFDAMTSIRPYRTDAGPGAAERALDELAGMAGTRYCGEAVEVLSRLFRAGRLGWILEHFNDRCELPCYGGEAHAVRETKRLIG